MFRMHVLILVVMLCPAPAFAYIDPGTGALLTQAILAVLGSVLLFYRSLKNKITRLLLKLKLRKKQ